MSFPFKQVLLVGATAGIGAAMADRLVYEGVKVIAVGRRQDRLDAFVHKHGSDKASAVQFDLSDSKNMDDFVSGVTQTYPDLDCVFLNAGIQSVVKLAEPETVDLSAFHTEMSVNFSSFVDITIKFLPFLKSKRSETGLIYYVYVHQTQMQSSNIVSTGSNLAIVPSASLPAYSASKAALNAFILCLREQLRDSSVKVIELSPPPVQSKCWPRVFGRPAVNEVSRVARLYGRGARTEPRHAS